MLERRIYVVVRTDLPPGAILPQALHAVAEVGRFGWIRPDEPAPIIVRLGVAGLDNLENISLKARYYGVRTADWCEPDFGSMFTALASEPIGGKMRAAFRGLVALSMASPETAPAPFPMRVGPQKPGATFIEPKTETD